MPLRRCPLMVATLVAVGALSGCAADLDAPAPAATTGPASQPAAAADEEGFAPIFNGRDLAGWVYGNNGRAKVGEGYRVRDGAIYCTATDGGNLFTDKTYTDFILRFEFKLTPNANNGVGIRAPLAGNVAINGIEIQVLDDTGSKYTALRPGQYHGSVYDCVAARRGHLKPVGEWNAQEITADGRRIKVVLNGVAIVDADLDEAVTDASKLQKHAGLKNKSGHIGFLGHGAEVEFRNLRVKELKR